MDANEYALKVQPAAKSLGMLLNQAHWLGKGSRRTGDGRDPPGAGRKRAGAPRSEPERSKSR